MIFQSKSEKSLCTIVRKQKIKINAHIFYRNKFKIFSTQCKKDKNQNSIQAILLKNCLNRLKRSTIQEAKDVAKLFTFENIFLLKC